MNGQLVLIGVVMTNTKHFVLSSMIWQWSDKRFLFIKVLYCFWKWHNFCFTKHKFYYLFQGTSHVMWPEGLISQELAWRAEAERKKGIQRSQRYFKIYQRRTASLTARCYLSSRMVFWACVTTMIRRVVRLQLNHYRLILRSGALSVAQSHTLHGSKIWTPENNEFTMVP